MKQSSLNIEIVPSETAKRNSNSINNHVIDASFGPKQSTTSTHSMVNRKKNKNTRNFNRMDKSRDEQLNATPLFVNKLGEAI